MAAEPHSRSSSIKLASRPAHGPSSEGGSASFLWQAPLHRTECQGQSYMRSAAHTQHDGFQGSWAQVWGLLWVACESAQAWTPVLESDCGTLLSLLISVKLAPNVTTGYSRPWQSGVGVWHPFTIAQGTMRPWAVSPWKRCNGGAGESFVSTVPISPSVVPSGLPRWAEP